MENNRAKKVDMLWHDLMAVWDTIGDSISKARALEFTPQVPAVPSDAKSKTPTTDRPPHSSQVFYPCCICLEMPNAPVVTQCGHLFCYECFQRTEYPKTSKQKWMRCPSCKCIVCNGTVIQIRDTGADDGKWVEIAPAEPKSYEVLNHSKGLFSLVLDSANALTDFIEDCLEH